MNEQYLSKRLALVLASITVGFRIGLENEFGLQPAAKHALPRGAVDLQSAISVEVLTAKAARAEQRAQVVRREKVSERAVGARVQVRAENVRGRTPASTLTRVRLQAARLLSLKERKEQRQWLTSQKYCLIKEISVFIAMSPSVQYRSL